MSTTPPDPLATVEDLELRVGEIPQGQVDNAESLLRYASSLVRAFGKRPWDDPETNPHQLVEVVVGMVERARDNPQGATQETAGPFTVSWGPNAAQRVYLTGGDREIIRDVAGRPALWTQTTTRGGPDGSRYVDVVGSDEPLPVNPPW